jgi:hypothetical protein
LTIQILDKHRHIQEKLARKSQLIEEQTLLKREYRQLKLQDCLANLEDENIRKQMRN